MNYKVFLKKYLISIIVFFLFYASFIYIIDPLSVYRFTKLYEQQYSTNARFQLPGFIRNTSFDTIILGSSMGRNFVESYVDEKLNVKSLNASIPGSTAYEQYLAANLALQKEEVTKVIWELNPFAFQREYDDVIETFNEFPFHLYDYNFLNDYKYLLTLYPLEEFTNTIIANISDDNSNRDREMLYKFGENIAPLTKEKIKPSKPIKTNKQVSDIYSVDTMLSNFEKNIIKLVENNQDVEFIFYYAPYAISVQVRIYNKNNENITHRLMFKEETYKLLSKYKNVKIFDFQDHKDITHTISNYMKDEIHYYMSINEYMIDYFASYKPIESIDEYKEKNNNLLNQILSYDKNALSN
ncbi:hypothetical protein CIB95_04825 [Lottiidibacillus patelloidae]|uniref:DUF1574 domain-containing protein n=1 Tax=Lottiidibacillus patelloidae TaxID=2670334 RepID=A0A263BVV5_9BACI|nr:hypothetical protein [Lottiidibacillus patelloidae]OZM57698.1 hypothetical protein CIB95_04825 [Lottiidibacillus patelloidae]